MPRLHLVQELPVGSSRRDQDLKGSKAHASRHVHGLSESSPPGVSTSVSAELKVHSRTAEAQVEQMPSGTIVTPSDMFRTKPRRFPGFLGGTPDEVNPKGRVEDGVASAEAVTTMMAKLES
ncbi:hypothetical protein AYL99_09432 [Fonsecaea erecta]|uniref:Uncharacterized protein n=1 Tax=Fonsecaea erecta TaxID=1367422 RepID=A0A178ZAM9_9EURO|nr:hypothetical protein AYL99_09432 [Fonsecaea erecta]OAP56253.1 hypothetical protein AYL99_09432 [Fonsecaea erecta]